MNVSEKRRINNHWVIHSVNLNNKHQNFLKKGMEIEIIAKEDDGLVFKTTKPYPSWSNTYQYCLISEADAWMDIQQDGEEEALDLRLIELSEKYRRQTIEERKLEEESSESIRVVINLFVFILLVWCFVEFHEQVIFNIGDFLLDKRDQITKG